MRVARVALGTMSFGGDSDEATAARMWRAARDAGVNLIDTADVYNEGRSEEMVGRLMRGERDELVIATKAYFPTGAGPNARGSSRFHLVRAVEASLRRLATDRDRPVLPASLDDATAIDESLRALDDRVRTRARSSMQRARTSRRGRSPTPSACWRAPSSSRRSSRSSRCTTWSSAGRDRADADGAVARGSRSSRTVRPAVACSPASTPRTSVRRADGSSTGKMYAGALSATPTTSRSPGRFVELAAELGHSPVTLAVAWAASHPAVTSVLAGARDADQLAPALAAIELVLDDATRARISALSPAPPPATDRIEELNRA